jgi:hypothetical protein
MDDQKSSSSSSTSAGESGENKAKKSEKDSTTTGEGQEEKGVGVVQLESAASGRGAHVVAKLFDHADSISAVSTRRYASDEVLTSSHDERLQDFYSFVVRTCQIFFLDFLQHKALGFSKPWLACL